MTETAYARIDDYAVFVPDTVTGDVIRVLIVKVKTSYSHGKLLKTIKSSPTVQFPNAINSYADADAVLCTY